MAEPSPPPSQRDSGVLPEQLRSPILEVASTAAVEAEPKPTRLEQNQFVTPSPSLPEPDVSDSLLIPLNDDNEVQMNDAPEQPDPPIKQEPTAPPRVCMDIASGDEEEMIVTTELHEPKIKQESATAPRIVSVDNTSNDDEFPSIAELLAQSGVVKQGSQTPKRLRELSKAPDANEADYYNDSDGSSAVEDAPPPAQPSSQVQAPTQPKRKQHKSQGKRAKTAREWWRRANSRLTQSQRRGSAYKQAQIDKIREEMKQNSKKRRNIKLSKRRAETFPDPRAFLSGGLRNQEPVSPQHVKFGGKGQPGMNASSRKELFKKFIEQAHGNADLHIVKGDFNDLVKKARSLGYQQLQVVDGEQGTGQWQLKGMANKLHNHQVLGLEFIVKRECSDEAPYGSILADDMGMGKTVQTIAAIVGNPPTREHITKDEKTTLIVVPSSLRKQWFNEIKRHAPQIGETIMQYRSSDDDNSAARLKLHSVVVTTYWEMFQSLPNPDKKTVKMWKALELDVHEEYQKWIKEHEEEKGLLHQVRWYRVVLDEGHYIKNYKSRTSRAAIALNGKRRLLLSGTPIMNSYAEFHPLFRFLREPLTSKMSPDEFEEKFCAQDDESTKCLSVILDGMIIHRTMKDKLFGEPIIQLPPDHRFINEFVALRSEAILYLVIELRLKELRHMTFPKEDERTRLSNPLAQLTRTRQLTANPDLIAQQIIVLLELDELRQLRKKVGEMRIPGRPKTFANILFHRFTLWIKDKEDGVYDGVPSDDINHEVMCFNCAEPSEDLYEIRNCRHTFCGSCLEENIIRDMVPGEDDDVEVLLCPECSEPFKDTRPLHQQKGAAKGAAKSAKESSRKGKDARGFRPTPAPNQFCFLKWLERFDEREIQLLPSAKIDTVCEQVREWTKETPEDKIIIFTQFRHFQVMLGCMLEEEKFGFVYFSGDMSSKQRERAIADFETNPSIKVMVAGLKCGGLGLNLSFANRVLITDIWWNVCIDDQAFGRVFRIGQEKDSYYVKLVVQSTVDSRTILALQRKKEKAIKAVMQDDLTEDDVEDILNGGTDETFAELMARFEPTESS